MVETGRKETLPASSPDNQANMHRNGIPFIQRRVKLFFEAQGLQPTRRNLRWQTRNQTPRRYWSSRRKTAPSCSICASPIFPDSGTTFHFQSDSSLKHHLKTASAWTSPPSAA